MRDGHAKRHLGWMALALGLWPTVRSVAVTTEEVRFVNGAVTLAGTLHLPAKEGPHPAVVCVHGSGAATRNSFAMFPTMLAQRGFAVLAYDKRGTGRSNGEWRSASYDVLAEDALAGLHWLQTRLEIVPQRIGLFGASQAGWIIPLAATRSKDVAFAVIISGSGVTVAANNDYAMARGLSQRGYSPSFVDEAVSVSRSLQGCVKSGAGWERLQEQINAFLSQDTLKSMGEHHPLRMLIAAGVVSAEGQLNVPRLQALTAKFGASALSQMDADPIPVLERVACPVFAVWGERDALVEAPKSLEIFRQALAKGKNPQAELVMVPGAGHNAFEGAEGDAALKKMFQWMLECVRPSANLQPVP